MITAIVCLCGLVMLETAAIIGLVIWVKFIEKESKPLYPVDLENADGS